MSTRESTPKPGKILSSGKAELLTEKFSSEFRPYTDSILPSNIPTACLLKGATIREDLSDVPVAIDTKVYALYENTNELYFTTMEAMIHYLKNREAWEDYDICIFDPLLSWCLGISHEDSYVWVTKE